MKAKSEGESVRQVFIRFDVLVTSHSRSIDELVTQRYDLLDFGFSLR
jgi:hypothetical protein